MTVWIGAPLKTSVPMLESASGTVIVLSAEQYSNV